MNIRNFAFVFGALMLLSGALSAISGVSVTANAQTRWAGNSSSAVTTEGGNITGVNITSNSLSDRWTAFYGNVTGTIILGNSTANIFSWSYAPTAGGKVCVIENASSTFLSPVAAVAGTVNTAFTMGSSVDNATGTFSGTCSALTLSTGSVAAPIKITHTGSSNFNTCGITVDSGTAKSHHAFCTVINSAGSNFAGAVYNYEIMAPAVPGTGTEAYYFYAELG